MRRCRPGNRPHSHLWPGAYALGAAGGIQITASHNPAPWNGLKLFGADGAVLPAARGLEVKAIYDSGQFQRVPWDKLGGLSEKGQAPDWHRDTVLPLINVAAIRSRRFRVLLDANGGAGGPLSKSLLTSLGCDVSMQGGATDGSFVHPPEPLAENLQTILPLVQREKADVGFVLDPDADRLAIIDEKGSYIGEELTLALAVMCRLQQEPGPVVINMSTSRVVEDLAKNFGVVCWRSAVGEANVVEKMRLGWRGNRRRRQWGRDRPESWLGARSLYRHGHGARPDGQDRENIECPGGRVASLRHCQK